MKAFIVYCHPSEESFTRNSGLREKNWDANLQKAYDRGRHFFETEEKQ